MAGLCWIGTLCYFHFAQTPFFGTDLGRQAMGLDKRPGTQRALVVSLESDVHLLFGLGDGYMTRILTGGLMGMLMWANVWLIIWPAQKVVIANAENVAAGGEANPAAAGGRAGMASRTNALFSMPMLFFMGSANHLPWFNDAGNLLPYWLITLAIVLFCEAQARPPRNLLHRFREPFTLGWG